MRRAKVSGEKPRSRCGFIVEKRVGTLLGTGSNPYTDEAFPFLRRALWIALDFPFLSSSGLFSSLPLLLACALLLAASPSPPPLSPPHSGCDALPRSFIYVFSAEHECPRIAARALARTLILLSVRKGSLR